MENQSKLARDNDKKLFHKCQIILLEVLYIGDFVSDDRPYEDKDYFLELAKKDIDQAVFESYCKSIQIRLDEGKTIHTRTVEARNEYLFNK